MQSGADEGNSRRMATFVLAAPVYCAHLCSLINALVKGAKEDRRSLGLFTKVAKLTSKDKRSGSRVLSWASSSSILRDKSVKTPGEYKADLSHHITNVYLVCCCMVLSTLPRPACLPALVRSTPFTPARPPLHPPP